MLDEKDLLAIREMIQEASKQTVKEAMQGASVLMESYFEPKFNLLFENQQTMLETLAPKSRVEEPGRRAGGRSRISSLSHPAAQP